MSKRGVLLGILTIVIVVAALVVTGCPPKPKPPAEEGPPVMPKPDVGGKPPVKTSEQPAGDTIKIGAIFSVTGAMAPLGEPEKRAAEMIIEEVNAKGGVLGKQVQIIIKDDKSETSEAALAAKDLIQTEKVCAIIGPSGTPTTLAITDICEQAKIPLVSCAAGRPITDPIKPYVFAVPQTDQLAVAKIVDYLTANKIKKVATIYVATPFGESGQKQMETQFKAANIAITASEKFGPEDADMKAQLTKIKATNPEAVICWGTNPGPASVTKDMKTLGMKMPLIQSHGVANAKYLSLAGPAAEGVMLPAGRLIVWESVPDSHQQKQVLKEFAEAFKAKYGVAADTFAGHAYDALHIVLKAIEAAGGPDPEKIRGAIENTRGFVGTAGVFNYSDKDHNGLTKDAFVWVKVENGTWKLAE